MPQNNKEIYIYSVDNSVIYYTYDGSTNYYIRGKPIGTPVGKTAKEIYKRDGSNVIEWVSSDGSTYYRAKGFDVGSSTKISNEIYVDGLAGNTINNLILVGSGKKYTLSSVLVKNSPSSTTATMYVYTSSAESSIATVSTSLSPSATSNTKIHRDVVYCKLVGSNGDTYRFALRNDGTESSSGSYPTSTNSNHLRSGYLYDVGYTYVPSSVGSYSCSGSTSTLSDQYNTPVLSTCSGSTGSIGATCAYSITEYNWVNNGSATYEQSQSASTVIYTIDPLVFNLLVPRSECDAVSDIGVKTLVTLEYSSAIAGVSTSNGENACPTNYTYTARISGVGPNNPSTSYCDQKSEVNNYVCLYQQLYKIEQCQCTSVDWSLISSTSNCTVTSSSCSSCNDVDNILCETYTVTTCSGSGTTNVNNGCACVYMKWKYRDYPCEGSEDSVGSGTELRSGCTSSTDPFNTFNIDCNINNEDTYRDYYEFVEYLYRPQTTSTRKNEYVCVVTNQAFVQTDDDSTVIVTPSTTTCSSTSDIGKYKSSQNGARYWIYQCLPENYYRCAADIEITECDGTDGQPASWTSFSVTES